MQRVKLKLAHNPQCHPLFLIILASALLLRVSLAAQDKLLRINTDLTAPQVAAVGSANAASAASPTQYDLLAYNSNNNAQQLLAASPTTATAAAAASADVNQPNLLAIGPTVVAATTIANADSHICMREEMYVEQLKVPTMQPVRIRSSQWCLEFPPRCSNYKTEMREVMQIKNVNKTRTIRFCCAGYEGNISINDTVCKPVCRGGCGRGRCQTPDVCSCEAGYTGTHCTQRCDHDHWGVECKEECRCQNGAVCDNKSGLCHCTIGWTGELCELPCPAGTYGVMCHRECDCATKLCHPQTGACTELPMETTPVPLPAPNVTHVMIQTLNFTIANITHNLDRIAKNIVNIAATTTTTTTSTVAPPTDLLALTTLKPLHEVIVIKQEDQHAPKIIVHQPAGALGGAGILGDLHAAGGKTPEVIHVITTAAAAGWPTPGNVTLSSVEQEAKLGLAALGGVSGIVSAAGGSGAVGAGISTEPQPTSTVTSNAVEHDANMLSTLLIILLIIIIAIGMSWLYIYRRYHWQKQRVEAALAARQASVELGGSDTLTMTSGAGGLKSYLKPLPDLPAFTQMVRNKIEGPEFYETPSNNSSVHTAPYDYARKLSLYSVISPKSRKGSPDSHLYDEIRYPAAFQHPHHQQHHHEHHHHQQHQHHQQQQQHEHHHQQHEHHHQQHEQHHHHQQLEHQHQHQQQREQHHQHQQHEHQHHQQHQHQHQQHQQREHHQHHQHHHQPSPTTLQYTQLSTYVAHQPPLATSTPQHHVTHLIIPPQSAKFLPVPSAVNNTNSDINIDASIDVTTNATRKIALL